MPYFAFIRANLRFLAFGFALAFFSSFGQTFYIGLFGEQVRDAFALTEGRYGTLYSVATLVSGFCVIWLGRQIDVIDLRLYSTLVCAGLVTAAFFMSIAHTVLLLWLALFMLRLFGQGLASHTAITTMARYFERDRGKAMSLAGLGFPAGEAVLPLATVGVIAGLGWRQTWLVVAGALAIMAVPLALLLLRGHAVRHAALLDQSEGAGETAVTAPENPTPTWRMHWTRKEVLRDPRFYAMLPAALSPAFVVTGFFFHQATVIESKGWSPTWFAACFVGFASMQLPSSLLVGPLVDRVSAVRLLPFYLLPLILAMVALAAGRHPGFALAFMMLAGVTSGIGGPIIGATWAELYGVLHLGAIRAMASAIMVFSTAASPVAMGVLIDRGVSVSTLAVGCLVAMVVACGLVATVRVAEN